MEMWVNFCIYSTSRTKPPGQMMTGLRNGFQKLSTTVEIKLGRKFLPTILQGRGQMGHKCSWPKSTMTKDGSEG